MLQDREIHIIRSVLCFECFYSILEGESEDGKVSGIKNGPLKKLTQ